MTAAAAVGRRASNCGARSPIRLMIVDDSPVARSVIERMLKSFDDFAVVATVGDAEEALRLLPVSAVDVVLLDLELPGVSGLEALPRIIDCGPRVLVVSSFCSEPVREVLERLPAGAAGMLPKPGSGNAGGRFADMLAERLRSLAGGRGAAEPSVPPSPRFSLSAGARIGCLAIGASTGGLTAVAALLRALPDRVGAPILVTQHLPAVFVPFFARQIELACGRTVTIAEDGGEIRVEEVVLAPGDAHLGLEREGGKLVARLSRDSQPTGCSPSVDVMFSAAASIYGPTAVAVVLSGMGKDGLSGSCAVKGRGGTVFAQDEASSAVWGMPRAVAEAGVAERVMAPAEIAAEIAKRLESVTCR